MWYFVLNVFLTWTCIVSFNLRYLKEHRIMLKTSANDYNNIRVSEIVIKMFPWLTITIDTNAIHMYFTSSF